MKIRIIAASSALAAMTALGGPAAMAYAMPAPVPMPAGGGIECSQPGATFSQTAHEPGPNNDLQGAIANGLALIDQCLS